MEDGFIRFSGMFMFDQYLILFRPISNTTFYLSIHLNFTESCSFIDLFVLIIAFYFEINSLSTYILHYTLCLSLYLFIYLDHRYISIYLSIYPTTVSIYLAPAIFQKLRISSSIAGYLSLSLMIFDIMQKLIFAQELPE